MFRGLSQSQQAVGIPSAVIACSGVIFVRRRRCVAMAGYAKLF